MQIIIDKYHREKFELDVESSDTIKIVKIKINDKIRFPSNELDLIFGVDLLEDEKTLASYSISEGSIILLTSCFQIFVKNTSSYSNGRTITLDVRSSDLIINLKQKIRDKEGIKPKRQRLFSSTLLQDDKTLAYYRIEKEATLKMIVNNVSKFTPIKTSKGVTLNIDAEPTDLVEEVKWMAFCNEKVVRPSLQILIFEGKQLEDGRTLASYNFTEGSTMHLIEKHYNEIKLFIRTLAGKIITLSVLSSHSVEHIKGEIHKMEGIMPDDQRLIFAGKQLEEGKTLESYLISHGSIIDLIID